MSCSIPELCEGFTCYWHNTAVGPTTKAKVYEQLELGCRLKQLKFKEGEGERTFQNLHLPMWKKHTKTTAYQDKQS